MVGASEEAVDDALLLTKFAAKVHLVAPASKLAVEAELERAVQAEPKIELLFEHKLNEVRGNHRVREVVLGLRDGSSRTLAVDGVFIYLAGNKPVTDFMHGELDMTPEQGCIRTDHHMETSIPGVFAAGDVRCIEFRQAITAAADGAIAAIAADRFINRREGFRPAR